MALEGNGGKSDLAYLSGLGSEQRLRAEENLQHFIAEQSDGHGHLSDKAANREAIVLLVSNRICPKL